jgi:transcriptional regulator with XRE-family HTH domain
MRESTGKRGLSEFSRLLLEYRGGVKRDAVALECGLSASYLYYLETGKRMPTQAAVLSLSTGLQLTDEQRQKLWKAAGFEGTPSTATDLATKLLGGILADRSLSPAQLQDFMHALQEFTHRWHSQQRAKTATVETGIIAAGGWQFPVLGNRFERTLLHAVAELITADIKNVIIVVPRDTPRFQLLQDTFSPSGVQIRSIPQAEPNGLGGAVLGVSKSIHLNGPVALLLPDEIDMGGSGTEKGTAMKEAVEQFEDVRHPIVVVNQSPAKLQRDRLRYFGVALAGDRLKGKSVYSVSKLQEKPEVLDTIPNHAWLICGRYVLTPEVFDALSQQSPKKPMRYELTEALTSLKGSDVPYIYRLNRDLTPLAPLREMFEGIDSEPVYQPETYCQ